MISSQRIVNRLIGGVFLLAAASVGCGAEIFTIYSDKGFAPGFTGVPVYSGSSNGVADGQNQSLPVVPEGLASWKMSDMSPFSTYYGWGVTYLPLDLSRFNSGELRFWIYSSVSQVKLELKDSNGVIVFSKEPIGLTNGQLNQWVQFRFPLAGVDLTSVANPFLFTATAGPGTFYIDDVRYVDNTVSSPSFGVSLKNASDNSPATKISWNSVVLPAGWKVSDQYLSVSVDANALAWGVQMYTDNRGPGANPVYSGVINSVSPVPAGLIDTTNTAQRLPLAWASRSDVSTITVVAANPNNTADLNSFQWLIVEDKAQVAVPSQHAALFQNGDPYITMINNTGIHFGQSPTEFGAENPPYRIYLEADFGNAIAPRTYQTSTLRVEFFTP